MSLSHFEDAYNEKVIQLRAAQAQIDVLKLAHDNWQERANHFRVELEALQKTLHCSRVSALTASSTNIPHITVVTTIRNGNGMGSVATLLDEMLMMAAHNPKEHLSRELNNHLSTLLHRYFTAQPR